MDKKEALTELTDPMAPPMPAKLMNAIMLHYG